MARGISGYVPEDKRGYGGCTDAELRVDTWFFTSFLNNLSMSSEIIIERFDQ